MSDQEDFQLEKEMEKVSKFKSFAKFMNNYAKDSNQQVQPPRETIQKSYQKNNHSYDTGFNKRDQQINLSIEKQKKQWPIPFQVNEQQYSIAPQPKQRITQEKIISKPRRQRQFPQAPTPQNLNSSHILKSPSSSYFPSAPIMPKQPIQNFYQNSNSQFDSYKARFQQLNLMFQEFKSTSLQEKRRYKQDLFSYEQQIQQYKVRIYELQVRQDELVMQNKKMKQRLTKDYRSEKQSQSFKTQIESRSEQLKRAIEQTNYYRGQCDASKKQLQNRKFQSQRQQLELRELRERIQCLQMEVQNKERLQEQLSQKISGLIKQNAGLRDDVRQFFRVNKELEYQLYNAKRELKRGGGQFNQNTDYNQSFTNLRPVQRQQRYPKQQQSIRQAPRPETKRRRGQFNQQRAKVNGGKQIKQQSHRKQIEPPKQQTTQLSSLTQRKSQLQEQIIKIRQQKTMTGAKRRVKIDLERELEKIYVEIESLTNEPQLRI